MKRKLTRGFPSKVATEVPIPPESLSDRVEEELEEQGITLFDNDNILTEYLRLPADITEVESRELGKYFTSFTQQKMWTRTLLGRASAMLKELNDSLDSVRGRVYSTLPTKMSVKEKELKVKSDSPEVLKYMQDISFYEEKKRMLVDYLDNLTDALFCISREVSRREYDFGDDKRDGNLGKRRRD